MTTFLTTLFRSTLVTYALTPLAIIIMVVETIILTIYFATIYIGCVIVRAIPLLFAALALLVVLQLLPLLTLLISIGFQALCSVDYICRVPPRINFGLDCSLMAFFIFTLFIIGRVFIWFLPYLYLIINRHPLYSNSVIWLGLVIQSNSKIHSMVRT